MADAVAGIETKEFTLEIVTPQRSVFSGLVQSFNVPGTMGGFEVLRDHAPLLATIGVGPVKLVDGDGNETFFATSGGFVQVENNYAVFLADSAERKDEIDVGRAQAARTRAAERIERKESETDLKRARAALARAINRLKVAEVL
ncbi:MAG: F0F1 ATP synthase subunit epsilon [Bacteroidetes bacterium]|nr:F0F1 ATP synthase subunit epsilon [Bacteroidota bacterium]